MAYRDATAEDLPDEFDTTDPVVVARAINWAKAQVYLHVWYDITSDAQALLASHFLKGLGEGTASFAQGPVRSRRVGDVSEEYAVVASVLGSDLESTSYGRAYLALKRTVTPTTFGVIA